MQSQSGLAREPQVGQICYVPLYVTPQTATASVPLLPALTSATMSAMPSSPATSTMGLLPSNLAPLLVQLPALVPQPAPAGPTAAAVAPSLAPGALTGLRFSNLTSLMSPPAPTISPADQAAAQAIAPSLLSSLSGLQGFASSPAAAAAYLLSNPYAASMHPNLAAAYAALASETFAVDGTPASSKKEIKFKYHMSLMPQLAVTSTSPKVEIKKKRKPRMRITGRVCTHCGASQTTEWRMGPEGRGTLCNACGLRYRKKLLADGRKDPNAKISMSMLLNTNKKATKAPTTKEEGSDEQNPAETPQ